MRSGEQIKLELYQQFLSKLANEFEEIEFMHIDRDKNQFAYVFMMLASIAKNDCGVRV